MLRKHTYRPQATVRNCLYGLFHSFSHWTKGAGHGWHIGPPRNAVVYLPITVVYFPLEQEIQFGTGFSHLSSPNAFRDCEKY
jgi:hypothetical protein